MTYDQAWDALFEDGPELPWRVRGAWLEGLGFNRAAPDDVLIRLLDHGVDGFLSRPQSDAVVAAATAHPDASVRARLAEPWSGMSAEQWTALILAEPSAARRAHFVERSGRREVGFTEEMYARLVADPASVVRAEAARLEDLPLRLLTRLTADPDPGVRSTAGGRAWEHLTPAERNGLLADPAAGVREAALRAHHRDDPMPRSVYEACDPRAAAAHCRLDPALAMALARHEDREVVHALAGNPRLDRDSARELVRHRDPDVRLALAGNPGLEAELVLLLAQDPERRVRYEASLHPGLDEEQRAAAMGDDEDEGLRFDVPWVLARHDDAEEMRRLARSVHPVLRSSVARAEHLPPDVVELLARDEDKVVRLFLAESCDDAPAAMLLEVWHWWTGSLSKPGRPRSHPNFPRTGLLRYADDPNPRLRQLALDDPGSTPELVERFALDPDDEVRRRAAEDPRLSPESAVRLLDDVDDAVRYLAIAHPALPVPVLVRLLREPRRPWEGAVRNPAIPGPVMHRMIDLGAAGP
ncbi:PE-PGRS family protein [Streptomyces sp. HUAS MG47]|uniref:PE-PGRS family protein n=1 Tax=Streptomyces solicamelliae TaxID=3231716 RepID=UPI0038779790